MIPYLPSGPTLKKMVEDMQEAPARLFRAFGVPNEVLKPMVEDNGRVRLCSMARGHVVTEEELDRLKLVAMQMMGFPRRFLTEEEAKRAADYDPGPQPGS